MTWRIIVVSQHYKCKPGQNLIHLALSYNFGAPGTDSTDIYYLGLVYNLVKFVHRMHEQDWLLRDICGFSIYVEDGSLRVGIMRNSNVNKFMIKTNNKCCLVTLVNILSGGPKRSSLLFGV